ncbi:protease pro-enzyme activation domain-containing protein [Sulfobacillus thermosulfidooxidans]|uniref:protease pro-enzyme activation domain-containing protein n=1 Tax=Sulfobacillus thermosulfidooxidans TaxID=28034 RepID=UPI0006B616FA|nr:protease pro-enzyme activation domain-containing protein [Sulfobacillus thermosulfidooxidans]
MLAHSLLMLLSTAIGSLSPSSAPAVPVVHLNSLNTQVIKQLPPTTFYHGSSLVADLHHLQDLSRPKTLSILVDSPSKIQSLERYSQAVSQVGNPLYHHFLSPRALMKRFGPSPTQWNEAFHSIEAAGWHIQGRQGFLVTVSVPAHVNNPAIPVSPDIWSVNGLQPIHIVHQIHMSKVHVLPRSRSTVTVRPENSGQVGSLSAFQFNETPTYLQQFPTGSGDVINLLSWNPDITQAIPAGLPFNMFVAAQNSQGTPVSIMQVNHLSASSNVGVYGPATALPASNGTIWQIELAGYSASSAVSSISMTVTLSDGQTETIQGTLPPFSGNASALNTLTGPELNTLTGNAAFSHMQGPGSPVALYVQGQIPSLADLQQLMTQESLPMPTVNFHYEDGATASMTSQQDLPESNIDIQAVASIDPGTSIEEYVFPANDPTDPLASFLNDLAQQSSAKIASISYGFFGIDPASITPLVDACTAEGITIVNASGDQGAWDSGSDPGPVGIDLMDAQAEVLSVGGLDIASPAQFDQSGNMTSVSPPPLAKAWGGNYLNGLPTAIAQAYTAPNAASSGGYGSNPIPSWQAPFLPATAPGIGAPDIAALAGIPGFLGISGGQQVAMGGTSLAAPLTAGWLSLFENFTGQVSGMGNINPWLYQMAGTHPSDFTQAQWGSNGVYQVSSSQDGTWNPVTGLGLPNWYQLALSLSSNVATHLVIQPSQSHVNIGQPITISVKALTASGSVTGLLPGSVVITSSDSQATLPSTLNLSGGTGQFSVVFNSPGTQSITVAVQNSGQTLFQASTSVHVSDIGLSLPNNPAIGTPVEIQATGGNDTTEYQFWVQNPATTQWTSSGAFSSRSYWTLKETVPGLYSVLLYVKTSQGTRLAATGHITFVNQSQIPMVSGLTVNSPSTRLAQGASITITAQAQDPDGVAEYQFWIHGPNNQWKMVQDYSPGNILSLTDLASGSYVIAVYALDKTQVAQGLFNEAYRSSTVIDVNSHVSLNAPSTATIQNPLTITANSSGITHPVYQFWYETPSGQWMASGNYQTQASFTFTPSQTGTYHIVVYAKDPYAPATAAYALAAKSTISVS